MHSPAGRLQIAVGLLMILATATLSIASGLGSRDFNGPDISWQVIEHGVPTHIVAQECSAGGARDSAGCEHVALVIPVGQSALLSCATSPIAILDELSVRMWVKATRPGVQLAARVVLPRSIDPQTKSAVSILIRGEQYVRHGQWQQISLAGAPRLLAQEVRVLRTEPGRTVDSREAYIDAVVLIVPGGPNGTEVWTDELDVDGIEVVAAEGVQQAAFAQTAPAGSSASPATAPAAEAPPGQANVRMQGPTLFVDGRPFSPRIIESRGEPLQSLAERGFNTVQLTAMPTAEQAADARRLALWFLVPPPRPDEVAAGGLIAVSDRILSWCICDVEAEANPDYLRRWVALVRQHDPMAGRPVVVVPEFAWQPAAAVADIVVARHPRLHEMTAAEFANWLESKSRNTKPGSAIWLAIPTQYSSEVAVQCELLTGRHAPPPTIAERDLEKVVRAAAIRGVRGYVIGSGSSLATSDAATKRRATALELINVHLRLLEPWLASGRVVGHVLSSDASAAAALLRVDHARLLVPNVSDPMPGAAQPAAPTQPAADLLAGKAFTVPGVPESSEAFRLSPVELRPLVSHRVAGGMRTVWEGDNEAYILLAEDPQVIASLRQRVAQSGPAVARLHRELAAMAVTAVTDTSRQLAQAGTPNDVAARDAAAAAAQIPHVDSLLSTGRIAEAARMSLALRATSDRIADQQRAAAATNGANKTFARYPLEIGSDQLAELAKFVRRLNMLRGGENLLAAGDFEDIGQLTQAGWQHVSHPMPNIQSHVQLSADRAQQGRYCLELRATATALPGQSPVVSPPVWIAAPPVHVDKGQLIEISGWVRVEAPITGSFDGLQIIDSLGGPDLSLAIKATSGWQRFEMLRMVPESGNLQLTFVLTGLGAAQVDGVMIRSLHQVVARRLPAIDAAGGNAVSTASRSGL